MYVWIGTQGNNIIFYFNLYFIEGSGGKLEYIAG